MNKNHTNPDPLERLTDTIRKDSLSDEVVRQASDRAWTAIVRELDHALSGCEDYQALIPDLVDGNLPEARALLVSDHTRQCVSCRRALLEARGGVAPAGVRPSVAVRPGIPRWLRLAAAAVVALGLGLAGFTVVGNSIVDHRLTATVAGRSGELQLVRADDTEILAHGAVVGSGQLLRTAKKQGSEIVLADGSMVELAPRSEIELGATMRGTTVRLHRGNIIVRAADQRGGRLRVATDDCLVAVKGTIFAVDHGFKGSRVSVIEGEVEVRQAAGRELLNPGQQTTTNDRLQTVAIEDQIAWSANSEQHLALLRELTSLQREVVDAVEPEELRRSTRLLDLAPPDTAVYVAVPNLAEGLDEARTIVDERIAASPVLRDWWQANVVGNGVEEQVDMVLDRLQAFGDAVGDEVVVTVPVAGFAGDAAPVAFAVLDDPARFRSLLAEHAASGVSDGSRPGFVIVDDPQSAVVGDGDLLLWTGGDLAVAAGRQDDLAAAVARITSGPSDFTGTELHARLAESYAQGVSWVIGLDMAAILDRAASESSESDALMMDELGLLDSSTMVFGYSRDGDRRDLEAALYFSEPRRGAASWLAEPSPMGSLDFVSPQASLAVAAVTKDGADMFDDLLRVVSATDPDALHELAELQRVLGIDFHEDLAAPLGGEGAFAVDGPVLPVPSWKLVLEVYDPEILHHTIDTAIHEINRQMNDAGRPGLTFVESTVGGRTYHVIRHPDTDYELFYLTMDGYLVMAPSAAIIEQALQLRASGLTLPRSAAFRELMPDNGYADCSALLWRNLGDLLDTLPAEVMGQLPPDAGLLLDQGAEPGLWCAYAGDDSILARGTGESLLSSLPVLGLSQMLRESRPTEQPADGLSSAG